MNNHELQALRKLFMLDVSEAAEFIGNVSKRAWQYWESGKMPVPLDIEQSMKFLLKKRETLIETLETSLTDFEVSFPYYHNQELFLLTHSDKNILDWRLYQSAILWLYIIHKNKIKFT